MPDSTYYYKLYKGKKDAVNSYEGDLKDLRKILNNLTDNLYDEIRAVNYEFDDLKSELNKGVRHNSRFTARANAFSAEKEKTVTADPNLRQSVTELQEEITRVTNLKNQAAQDSDYYYRKYQSKREEEKQALLDKLKIF